MRSSANSDLVALMIEHKVTRRAIARKIRRAPAVVGEWLKDPFLDDARRAVVEKAILELMLEGADNGNG